MKEVLKKSLILLVFALCLTGCGNDTKKKYDVEFSALGYIDAVEKQVMLSQIDSTLTTIESGKYQVKDLKLLGVKVKGEEPTTSSVVIIKDNGTVDEAWLRFDDYKVYYDGSHTKVLENSKDYPVGKAKNRSLSYKSASDLEAKVSDNLNSSENEDSEEGSESNLQSTSYNNTVAPVNSSTDQHSQNSTPSISVSKQNALKSAKSYLSFSAFSREGLIEQLEYEKYSHDDAVYAVDNCGADWNQQALKSAKSYLSFSAFSYNGLKEQLEYEGFTSDQATYGVNNSGANWNEQAAKSAKSYLNFSSFSRDGLIEQLEYEGFTHEQAEYGTNSVGL